MEKVIVKYSDFFEDDGGMIKIKQDFVKLGDDLVTEAKRIKKMVNEALVFENPDKLNQYEVQMAQVIELSKNYKKAVDELNKIQTKYNEEIKNSIKNEKELLSLKKSKTAVLNEELKAEATLLKGIKEEANARVATNRAIKSEIQAEDTLNKSIITENNVKMSNIRLAKAQNDERLRAEKAIQKETDLYNIYNEKLRESFRISANLSLQMKELENQGLTNTDAYRKLSNQVSINTQKTKHFDTMLKDVDASLGRHQRKVGQYENGWNGLSNSINQITREFPAFTYSMQTGFMALSNNIPILVDEISNLVKKNKELEKSGKPTKSALLQVVGALFSWQTALSLAITVLTVYGEEIYNAIEGLFRMESALKDTEKAQLDFLNSIKQGQIAYDNVNAEYQRYLKLAKDTSLSDSDRMVAVKWLQKNYPQVYKDVTALQLMNGKLTEEQIAKEKKLNQALMAKSRFEETNKSVEASRERITLLDAEIRKRMDYEAKIKAIEAKMYFGESSKSSSVRDKGAREISRLEEIETARRKNTEAILGEEIAQAKTRDLQNEIVKLKSTQSILEQDLYDSKSRSLFAEEEIEKATKKTTRAIKEQIDAVDYLASKFELEKTILEGNIKTNEKVFESSKYTYEQRINAQSEMVKQSLDLANLEKTEALRILKNKYDEERKETVRGDDGKSQKSKYTKKGLLELEKQYNYDVQKATEEHNQKIKEINEKGEQFSYLKMLNMRMEYLKTMQEMNSKDADKFREYGREISVVQQKIDEVMNRGKRLELADSFKINEGELNRLYEFRDKIDEALKGKPIQYASESDKKKALKAIEQFEKEAERLEKNASKQRTINKIEAIKEDMKNYEIGTNEYIQKQIEIQNLQIQLEKEAIKERLDNRKEEVDKWKDFSEEIGDLLEALLDRMIEVTRRRIDNEERLLDAQADKVSDQRTRAQNGMDNTLAYEEKAMAEREAMLLKQQKREERLQKIKAIWTSYSNYADKDANTAIAKALRDFALIETITASFGDGGVVEDKLPSNGIFRGQSHKGNNGGIPILVEGKEGIFSTKEMANLGKDNFYKIKELAGSGKIDGELFPRQNKRFNSIMAVPAGVANKEVLNGLKQVKEAIESKPESNLDTVTLTDGIIEIVELVKTKNKVTRNKYFVRKNRL